MKKASGKNPIKVVTQHGTVETKKVVVPISINDKATKRILAPYVRIVRKAQKAPVEVEENKQFSFYLQKKPSVLLRDLSSFLSDSVDLPSLLHETSEVLKNVTKASGVTLYLLDTASNEIYQSKKEPPLERHKIRWKIEDGTTIAAFVANKKEYVMVEDILLDDRFPEGIGYNGETIKSVLCVPVVTPEGECIAVMELYRPISDHSFTNDDLKITIMVTGWMGAAIHQNQQRLALKRQQELNDYLLDLTKCYFADTVLMEKMIIEVVNFAKVTLGAERGSFYVIDKESDELVADLFDEGAEGGQLRKSGKVRFGRDRGIAGVVARTGVTINVKDAYSDVRFSKEIEQKAGFITRSILCMPVMGVDGVLGVVQVVNKKSGGGFSNTDEALFNTFSMYCALTLHYTHVNNQLHKLLHQNNIFRKIIQLQQKPCIHDLEAFISEPETTIPADFETFSWYISPDSMAKMPQFCLYMILQLIDISDVNVEKVMHCLLSIRKFHRDNPYHNFEHGFNVCHCMHVILRRNRLKFSLIEVKVLMFASLCHDIDHSGFSNNFIQEINDDLALLYEDSFMENHHFEVTMLLLNGSEIYRHLSESDFKLLTNEIRNAILATDLSLHFRTKHKLVEICQNESFNWENEMHRTLLKGVMMTSCDISGQCKPFNIAKMVTEKIYCEYYQQGDLEKTMGLCPLSIMDRDKQNVVPEDQVQFLTIVVIPCVDLLRTLLPNTGDLYDVAITLRKTWQEIIDVRGKKCWRQDDSIVLKSDVFKYA